MKIVRLLALLLLATSTASAGEKGALVFAAGYDTHPFAVSILQRADYASMTATIWSDQKESADQFQELALARQTLIQEAKKNPKVLVHTGPVSLSPEPRSSLSKVASYSGGSDATVHLLYSLADNKGDVFQAARELAALAKAVKAPGKASYRFSSIRLVVDTPERYRPKLLQMIFDDIKQARLLAKKSGKVMLTGLDHPVLVRQADDSHVELFLDYAVSMELPEE